MEPDITQINICIARYYCNIIHNNLVGQIKQRINGHVFYINLVTQYIEQQHKTSKILLNNIGHIAEMYRRSTGDIISSDMLVSCFVMNYTFIKVYENIKYIEQVEIMNSIIYKTLISYFEWVCSKDEKAYFGIELSEEQKINLRNKLIKEIKLNGAMERFSIYHTDNETVPKKLFLELKKQYDRLKRNQQEDSSE